MSADNWCICPKCYAVADRARQERIDEAVKAAHAAYGVAPAKEYLRLSQAAAKAKGENLNFSETLREDYRIGINSNDVFEVEYYAKCSECGFAHTFKHSHPLTV